MKYLHDLPQSIFDKPVSSPDQIGTAAFHFGNSDYTKSLLRGVTPEELLWLAVIHQAVLDAELPASSGKPCHSCHLPGDLADHHQHCPLYMRSVALNWFASESEREGSLVWICERLSLNPAECRRLRKLGRVVFLSTTTQQLRSRRYASSKKGQGSSHKYESSKKGRAARLRYRRRYRAKGVQ